MSEEKSVSTSKSNPFDWLGDVDPKDKNPFHTIQFKRRKDSTSPIGAHAKIFLDGIQLKGVTDIKVEMHAKGMNKVTLEMYACIGETVD